MASSMRRAAACLMASAVAAAGVGAALICAGSAGAAGTYAPGITGGQTLTSGSTLQSPDGRYRAVFSSGKLSVAVTGGRTLTTIGTSSPGAYSVLQPNGSLVIFDASGQVLFDNAATGTGCPALEMQDDGNLVDYDTTAIWATNTPVHELEENEVLAPGQAVYAKGLQFQLKMQTSGNLTLENAAGTKLWTSGTGSAGSSAVLKDGDLEVVGPTGKLLWDSKTSGNSKATLEVESGGNLEIVASDGTVRWQTKTSDAKTAGSFPVESLLPSATPCPATVAPPTTTVVQTETQTVTTTSTATVTVPTTTVVTVAVPTPSPKRHLSVTMKFDFRSRGAITNLHAFAIAPLPKGAKLTATYNPHLKGHRIHVLRAVPGRTMIVLVTYLRELSYRPGQTLNVDITRPGYRNEWATFTFRVDNLPAARGNIVAQRKR